MRIETNKKAYVYLDPYLELILNASGGGELPSFFIEARQGTREKPWWANDVYEWVMRGVPMEAKSRVWREFKELILKMESKL